MMLIDTSVLVPVFRDKTGRRRNRLRKFLGGADFVLTRFTQIELLQGSSSEAQWTMLHDYLDGQDYAEINPTGWAAAARTYFDLSRAGLTVRSILDCCIAEVALRHRLTLIHDDQDFEAIAKVRPLRQRRVDLD